MKVVICSLNSKYIHSSLAPWCLMAGVKKYCNAGISTNVIEGTINEPIENIIERIIGSYPDVIGFCTYIWNVTRVLEITKSIKRLMPNIIIILGGPEVSYNADGVLLSNGEVNFILSGEGEKSFPEFLNAVYEKRSYRAVEGLCYRDSNSIIVNPPYILNEDPISPYTNEYFDNLNGRIAYLETSRGCPYSCAFCLSGRCGDVRFFDILRAENDIIALANSGTKTIKLVDRTFNANKQRAKELFRFIIENHNSKIPNDVCIHFEIAGDILDSETIEILSYAPIGSMQMEIGLQSFNEKTLNYINRKTNTLKLKSNIKKLVKNNNMHIHIDLIAGLPFEDFESFKQSFNNAFELSPNMLQLGFLKLLHGAEMREHKEKFPCKFSKYPPYEVISTPWISEEELMCIHNIEDALDRLYNSGRFKRTLRYVLDNANITAFELFNSIGVYLKGYNISKITLDKYTELVYCYFKSLNEINENILRDLMVMDRLSTNASGSIPKVLQVQDKELKKYRACLNSYHKPKENIKRGVAILYSSSQIAYVDYINKNPINGEYALKTILLSELPAE